MTLMKLLLMMKMMISPAPHNTACKQGSILCFPPEEKGDETFIHVRQADKLEPLPANSRLPPDGTARILAKDIP